MAQFLNLLSPLWKFSACLDPRSASSGNLRSCSQQAVLQPRVPDKHNDKHNDKHSDKHNDNSKHKHNVIEESDANLHIKSLPNISSLHKLAGDCVQGSSSLPKRYIVLGYEIVIDKPGQGRRCCWIPESLRHRWEAWCWRWWDFSAENRNSHPQRLPFPP